MLENKTHTLSPDQDLGMAVAAGLVKGVDGYNTSHSKTNVPSGSEVIIVQGGNYGTTAYPFLSEAGEDVEFLSSSGSDTAVTLLVQGLGADGEIKQETVALAGTTPVVSAGWWRINDVLVLDPTPAAGTITTRRAADAAVLFTFTPQAQQAFSGVYTVPARFTASIVGLIAGMQKSTGSNTAAIIRIYTRVRGSAVYRLEFVTIAQRDGDPSPDFKNPVPARIAPGTDVIFTVEGESAGQAVFLRSSWKLLDVVAYPLDNDSI